MNAVAIPICFTCFFLVLMWMMVEGRTHWVPKFGVAIMGVILGVQLWCSIDSYRGFDRPVTQKEVAGHRALFFWSRTDEPTSNDEGDSVLWMRMEDEISPYHYVFFAKAQDSPQVYRFPYDRDFAGILQGFNTKVADNGGQPIEVIFQFNKEGDAEKRNGRTADSRSKGEWVAYDLPPPKLPPKLMNGTEAVTR